MKIENVKVVSKNELAIAMVNGQEASSGSNDAKDYIEHTKKLLEDFKMMQNVILNAQCTEVPLLLKVAKTNMTKACFDQINDIIQELQVNFSEKSINLFFEKSISIITSMDTANFIYGNIVEVNDIKKYLSTRLTKVIMLRSEKLMNSLKSTNFEERSKINVIVDNLNLCNKLLDYCWDIYPQNIKCLAQGKKILERLIINRVKLGLDNYNVELLKILIDKNDTKIEAAKNKQQPSEMNPYIDEKAKKYDKNIIVDSEEIANTINAKSIEENSTETSLVVSNDSATEKFIQMTNDVIKEVTSSDSNDFLNVALQRFYSILNAIETVNYLKGETINKQAITENVSNLIIDLVERNFTAISRSWNELNNKTPEDNVAYLKELNIYKEMFIEAYKMCPSNIQSLKKYVEVQTEIFNNKGVFNLSKGQESLIETEINERVAIIKKVDSKYISPLKNQNKPTTDKKKKSWWSKLFNN